MSDGPTLPNRARVALSLTFDDSRDSQLDDQAVLGSLDSPPADRQDWFRDALAEQDAATALQHFVEGVMGILLPTGPLDPVMVSSADEEVRRAFDDRQTGRYESYRQVVQALIRRGCTKSGLDEDKATDLLFALLSPELHSLLCSTRGWSLDRFKTWMLATLEAQLLRPQGRQQRPRHT